MKICRYITGQPTIELYKIMKRRILVKIRKLKFQISNWDIIPCLYYHYYYCYYYSRVYIMFHFDMQLWNKISTTDVIKIFVDSTRIDSLIDTPSSSTFSNIAQTMNKIAHIFGMEFFIFTDANLKRSHIAWILDKIISKLHVMALWHGQQCFQISCR